jgi:hypothetical protein
MDQETSGRAPTPTRSLGEAHQSPVRPGGKTFRDITAQWHAGFGGWSWNARFADLDNDGWQDLLRGAGLAAPAGERLGHASTGTSRGRASRRRPGVRASRITCPPESYVYVDVDNDGDLDVITHPSS